MLHANRNCILQEQYIRNWVLGLKRTCLCQTFECGVPSSKGWAHPFKTVHFRARDALLQAVPHIHHQAHLLPPREELKAFLLIHLEPSFVELHLTPAPLCGLLRMEKPLHYHVRNCTCVQEPKRRCRAWAESSCTSIAPRATASPCAAFVQIKIRCIAQVHTVAVPQGTPWQPLSFWASLVLCLGFWWQTAQLLDCDHTFSGEAWLLGLLMSSSSSCLPITSQNFSCWPSWTQSLDWLLHIPTRPGCGCSSFCFCFFH